jgi:hypothetical protein
MQNGATALCAYSINVLTEVFEDRLINRKLWPAKSPDVNPCDFYLWENLKDKVYSNNPHTLDKTITSLEVNKLKLVSMFSRDMKFYNSRREAFSASTVMVSF